MFVADAGVRNLLDAGHGDAAADGVRLLTMTGFLNHPGAADVSGFNSWDPTSAANRAEGLAATTAGGAGTGTWSGTGHLWIARNLLGLGHPVASANLNLLGFGHRLADGVADVFVAGFRFCTVGGAADFAALGFVDRLADRAADVAIAGLEARLTDGATDFAVASLVARFANGAADIAVAGLEARFTNGAADIAVASLVARLADRIAFVSVAGFVDIARASHGNLFAALFVHSTTAVIGLRFPNGFANGFVTRSAALLGGAVGTSRSTGVRWAALRASGTAVKGFCLCVPGEGN